MAVNKNNEFFLVNHPLVESKISMLRDKNTGNKEFRSRSSENRNTYRKNSV